MGFQTCIKKKFLTGFYTLIFTVVYYRTYCAKASTVTKRYGSTDGWTAVPREVSGSGFGGMTV